jgi:hypothetical protein
VPYRRAATAFRFEWVGDPAQHELTVRPALLALADRRLAGAGAEFEEALAKRPLGVPKNLKKAGRMRELGQVVVVAWQVVASRTASIASFSSSAPRPTPSSPSGSRIR